MTAPVVMTRAMANAPRPATWSRIIDARPRTPKVRRRFAAVFPTAVTNSAMAFDATAVKTVRRPP